MASDSDGNSSPGFIVGILFVVVLLIAGVFFFNGGGFFGGGGKSVNVNVDAPAISAPAKGG